MIKKIHIVGIAMGVVVTGMAWWLSGAPILERGTWAVACYITVFVAGFLGSVMADFILTDRAELKDEEHLPVVEKTSDTLLAEVEKMIVGLRVANERIADLEKRLSSISIVAGMRPANRVIQDLKK